MNENSLKNLRPIRKGELSKAEAKKRGSIGGKKSAENKQKFKQLKAQLLYLLDVEDKDNKTMREKICLALISQALIGNIKAFEVIRNTIGEAIPEKIETINSNIDITDKAIIDEVYRKIKEL